MSNLESILNRLDKPNASAVRMRREWLNSVDRLLKEIERWLKEGDSKGRISTVRFPVSLHEPDFGDYDTEGLAIKMPGGRTLRIEPRGAQIVGVISGKGRRVVPIRGRVDVVSGVRASMLLRTSQDEWVIESPTLPTQVRSVKLSKQTFVDAIDQLLT